MATDDKTLHFRVPRDLMQQFELKCIAIGMKHTDVLRFFIAETVAGRLNLSAQFTPTKIPELTEVLS